MGVENGMFRSEIGSGFEDPGGTLPPRIPRSTPPGLSGAYIRLSGVQSRLNGAQSRRNGV